MNSQKGKFNKTNNNKRSKGRSNARWNKNNGFKPKTNAAMRGLEELEEGKFDSTKNDWRWYATNPQLVKDAASYPYTYALGSRLYLGSYGADMNKMSVPGVCGITFVPTIGYSDQPNSPINVASRSIYSDIRHTNSGAANYDPVDLMVYLVGMDSCYMILEFMKRVYGTMRLVSPVNRYQPRALVTAMGVDYDDVNANLDDFRAAINTYAQKLKALVIPNGMSYMAKHQWMVSGLYQDHPTDKSQIYVFTPACYFKFALDSDGAGMLESKYWNSSPSSLATFTDCVNFMNDLLDPLLSNQDFSIISGDILKWRGEGGVVVPMGITETYQVFPVYDSTVLDQIQNATLLGTPGITDLITTVPHLDPGDPKKMLEIRQDPTKSYLISTPWFRHPYRWRSNWANPGRNAYMVKRIINFDHDGVQPEETMEAARLSNIARSVTENATTGFDWFEVTTLGSEAVLGCIFYWYGEDAAGNWVLHYKPIESISQVDIQSFDSTNITQDGVQAMADKTKNLMLSVDLISCFFRHPYFALTTGIIDTSNNLSPVYGTFQGYFGDINYYSVVDIQDLEQMSEVALMSEFNVRMQG